MKVTRLDKILKAAPKDIEVPYHAWTLFGEGCQNINLAGAQASFGGDFTDLPQLRKAIEWYALALGAKKIEWED